MDYLVGYGSLLNKYSRETYSKIFSDVRAVRLQGWYRSWCAAYPDENATYAGAQRDSDAELEAVLLPTHIGEELQLRERNYQFIELDASQLLADDGNPLSLAGNDRVLICATTEPLMPSTQLPLPQSYVDTCMLGCLENGGLESMRRFVDQTQGWEGAWIDDRRLSAPIYPRYALPNNEQRSLIDDVLAELGVIRYRQKAL